MRIVERCGARVRARGGARAGVGGDAIVAEGSLGFSLSRAGARAGGQRRARRVWRARMRELHARIARRMLEGVMCAMRVLAWRARARVCVDVVPRLGE